MKNLTICILGFLFALGAAFAQETATRQDTLRELMRRVDILTQELERAKLGEVAEPKYESRYGLGPAASRIYQRTQPGISIAGYGEMVYENYSSEADDGRPSGRTDQIDFLRHITYLGFRFNDWLLFNSEIEVEHAHEIFVEFAYVEAQLSEALNVRVGMLLIPIGIINEFHEPPTFHGALRPETERNIIPTTWRANGVGIHGGTAQGLAYKLYVVESLNAENFSSNGIRGGRQKGAQAKAEDFGVAGRLNYTGVPGLDVGASFFVGQTGQGLTTGPAGEIGADLTLYALHAMFARHGFELRGLFAQFTLDDVTALNNALGLTGDASIGEKQTGYYLTVAYDILALLAQQTQHYLAPFVQFEKLNTQDEVPTGFAINPAREGTNVTFGITYKPHPNVAFKADFINRDNEAGTAVDQFNFAVNYLF